MRKVKRRLLTAVPAVLGVLLLGIATAGAEIAATKSTLPAKTSADVRNLITQESAVLSQLRTFQKLGKRASVAGWETGLRNAEAAQTKAEATLNADLVPPKKAPHPGSNALSFKDENGNPYTVAQTTYWDPAQPVQYEGPDPGTRLIAVEFRITDTGSHQISDDANNNATVIGSNDQTYTSAVNSVTECTNFNDGEYQLNPGQSVTGCVVFELPDGVKLSKIEWSPNGGFGGGFGTWG